MIDSSPSPAQPSVTPSTPVVAVVIPAGGSGTRLWPRSRKKHPKQLLDIVSPGKTMIQETVERVVPQLTSAERIYVITNATHADQVRSQLPNTPARNVVGEPVGRDSAPAIAIMSALIENDLGGDAIMVVLAADHAISDIPGFQFCINTAVDVALQGYLVTLGIDPTGPDTGFGYIRRGEAIHTDHGPAFAVKQFREKPDKATAQGYLDSGEYSWNAGMFVAKVSTFRELFKRHAPEMESPTAAIIDAYDTHSQDAVLNEHFQHLPKISVDFAIVEKAEKIAVVPASIGWSDVGSWSRLAQVLGGSADESGNIVIGDGHHLLKTRDTLVYSPSKMVAVIGVDNLVIVETPDAILVATKEHAEDVKQIVEALQKQGRHELI